ncbi:ank-repeat protein mbp1 [Ceratocystis lukuohia]|uniref:Ank-repeat protein mbp1 n=1 Tax=Ceratocystis lukuohia TaxID=2019550 RepID=A0ABR4MNU2_9PEZI
MAAKSYDGIYSATYSGIPVFEFLYGPELKESVMRRQLDNWINATHILKAAGFDKPSRTRILEREVQKDTHEKIQGGYGKYQGTWIPLENGKTLAIRNNTYEKLAPIFEYVGGDEPPPPAPRHTSKPKQPKRPAGPKWKATAPAATPPVVTPIVPSPIIAPPHEVVIDTMDMIREDDIPDTATVVSVPFAGDDERIEPPQPGTGHRKRKRDENLDFIRQQHAVYGDELLDYFLLSRDEKTGKMARRPDPPPNFQADHTIDTDENTALHWACAMGDIEVIKELKRFGASLDTRNSRGETPFMRSVTFTNCFERDTFPAVMKELWETVNLRDITGATVIHHAATLRNDRVTGQSCSRYYLDHILNKLQETHDPAFVQSLVDAQDNDGNTAIHLAAKRNARKCVRSLIGRNASTEIPNVEGITGEEMIKELNSRTKDKERVPQRSSSPFGPDSQNPWLAMDRSNKKLGATYQSNAAKTVHSSITPLIFEKLQSMAHNFEDEWSEKDQAEKEARQILVNTQTETSMVNQEIQTLESQLEPDDVAAKVMDEATRARHELLELVRHRNGTQVQATVDQELKRMGNNEEITADDSIESKQELARSLSQAIKEEAQAEADYVDALSMVGTGEKIEKYRRLLRNCLDAQDAGVLDENIDDLIEMMEEDEQMIGPGMAGASSAGSSKIGSVSSEPESPPTSHPRAPVFPPGSQPRWCRPLKRRKFSRRHPGGLRLTGEMGRKLRQAVAQARVERDREQQESRVREAREREIMARLEYIRIRRALAASGLRGDNPQVRSLNPLISASASTSVLSRHSQLPENLPLPLPQAMPPLLPNPTASITTSQEMEPLESPADRMPDLSPMFPIIPAAYPRQAEAPMPESSFRRFSGPLQSQFPGLPRPGPFISPRSSYFLLRSSDVLQGDPMSMPTHFANQPHLAIDPELTHTRRNEPMDACSRWPTRAEMPHWNNKENSRTFSSQGSACDAPPEVGNDHTDEFQDDLFPDILDETPEAWKWPLGKER